MTELPEAFPPIDSERLLLVWMSPGFMRLSLAGDRRGAQQLLGASLPAGWPDEATRKRISLRLDQMRRNPEAAQWLLRAIVRKADNRLVGYINFHGPPIEGRAELGYTVFEEERRRGYAAEAAQAMMAWAAREKGVRLFVVSISPSNEPSLSLAARLGFERIGTHFDEDEGEEWVFELAWPQAGSEGT